jgi:hypothetical protein
MAYQAKTQATKASVTAYLDSIEDDARRRDCKALVALMRKATGCPPVMWGPSIVGFDRYRYTYASGNSGESCIVGFAPRKGDLTIYMVPGYEDEATKERLSRLGKHKTGKACLYVKRLADIRVDVLEELVRSAVVETRRRWPDAASA